MNPHTLGDPLTFALIDATAGPSPDCPAESRYATPIANTPLICHVFDELAKTGIRQARIIAAPSVSEDLGRALGQGGSRGIVVTYVNTPVVDSRHLVLAELELALSQQPVLLHPGDCLFGSQLKDMHERFSTGDVDSVLPAQASVGSRRDSADRRLSDTVVVLGPGTRPLFGDLLSSTRQEDDLIETLLHSDCRLAVCEQTEHWYYSDSTEDLLAANRMMLDSLPALPCETDFSDDNQLQGRVHISPAACVSNCVVHGPVSIDAHAVVEDSFIGPYTSIGPDTILCGTEIDNSMVLKGAEVRHPGSRIEASIIGERARVIRSFALPKGLHLRLGSDSRVTFS
jgi:glucose-1-phosphate thymidylyltransferase